MLARLLSRIRQPEESTDPQTDLALAAAVLFLEVAWADHDIAENELQILRASLMKTFDLGALDADAVIEEGRNHHQDSVGMHGFTSAINQSWSLERRTELVTQLWRLAYSDDVLNKYEEYTIRKIADMLYVSHSGFIHAKLIAKRASVEERHPGPLPPADPPQDP